MPLASQPRLSGSLPAAVALTFAAGFADAHIFLHVTEVFVANMSGNLVLSGMAIGEAHWRAGLRHAVAIVAFALGAAVASWFHDRRRRSRRELRPDLLLAVEAVLLLAVAVWVAAAGDGAVAERAFVYPVILVGGFAMGMQNAALLRVGATAVATTYASGSVARLGSETVLAAGAPTAEARAPHRRALAVLAGVVLAYVAGAGVAAWAGAAAAWLLLPAAVLAVAAASTGIRRRRDEWDEWDADIRGHHPADET